MPLTAATANSPTQIVPRASDSVDAPNIEGIVPVALVFQHHRHIAYDCGQKADQKGSPGLDKPGGGGDRGQAGHCSGQAATKLGFFSHAQAIRNQASMATEAAILVLTKAKVATPLAARALPLLKPNQPNHNKPVPRATKGMLCGRRSSPGWMILLPTTKTEASAAMPALRWTTRPPAKSTTPI